MEHINKKSFPACTRVTGHATFSQPLQPISLAFTSRHWGGFTPEMGGGLRSWNRGWASFTVERGWEGCERDGPEGRRLCCGTSGWGETYCLRTKHLPQKPPSHPLPCPFWPVSFSPSVDPVHLPLVSIHSRSCHWRRDTFALTKKKTKKERKKEKKGRTDDSAIGESERQLYVLSTKSGSSIWSRITNIWTSQSLEIETKFRERERSRNSSCYDIQEWKWHTPFEKVNQISYVATGQFPALLIPKHFA